MSVRSTPGARRAALAGLGLGLFLVSFAGANPSGAVSDEPDQYIKAVAAGHLDVLGSRTTESHARSMDYWLPDLNKLLTGYPAFAQLARAYAIPSSLDPRYLGCTVSATLATCLYQRRPPIPSPTEELVSSVGTYPPFIYMPAGLVMRLGSGTVGDLLVGRLTFTLMNVLLLLGALLVALRARPGPLLVAAITLCVTPTSVLVMSGLTSSGPETAAGIAFWIALLAATEPRAPRGAWWLALAAGLVCGLSRSTGPVWMLFIALVVALFRGRRASWRSLRAGGGPAIAAVTVCVVACIVTIGWQVAVQPPYQTGLVPTLGKASPSAIGSILSRAVGTYGWGEAAPPALVTQTWALLVAVLIAVGVASALARRARGEIVALAVAGAAIVVVIAAFLAFGSHAGVIQGRWFLAPLAGIPILSGWMAASQPATFRFNSTSRVISSVLVIGSTVCLAVSWWLNEYRYSVDGGSLFFPVHSLWQPPFGWTPWIACAVLGLLALLAAGLQRATAPIPAPQA